LLLVFEVHSLCQSACKQCQQAQTSPDASQIPTHIYRATQQQQLLLLLGNVAPSSIESPFSWEQAAAGGAALTSLNNNCNMSNAAGARTALQPQVLANQESGSKASHLDIYLESMGTSAQATRTVQQQQQQQQQHQAGVLMSWGALASGGATVQTGQQHKVFVERGPAADLASGITAGRQAGRGHHHLHSKRVAGQPTTQQQKPLK
jgi:hypothetical protein